MAASGSDDVETGELEESANPAAAVDAVDVAEVVDAAGPEDVPRAGRSADRGVVDSGRSPSA